MIEAIYLYVLFESSAAGNVYKWRIRQPDMPTCIRVLGHTKALFPNKTTENELGVVYTCGGEVERNYGSKWYVDKKEEIK